MADPEQSGNARFRAMVEALPSMVFEADAQGANTWSSEARTCYTGLTPAQLALDGRQQAIHPDDLGASHAAWLVSLRSGSDFSARRRTRHHDGQWRWHPMRGADGAIQGWAGSATNIDDLVRAEAARSEQEQQARFMLALDERLRELADPQAMLDATTAALGSQLAVAQVGYGEIDAAQAHVTVHRDWNDGRIPSVVGTWRVNDFGPAFIKDLKAGHPIVIPDVRHDARTNAPTHQRTGGAGGICRYRPAQHPGRAARQARPHGGHALHPSLRAPALDERRSEAGRALVRATLGCGRAGAGGSRPARKP
jgi:PAS domain S-box-containing protein